eukprot:5973-Heterococcus_DN1.PRE.1
MHAAVRYTKCKPYNKLSKLAYAVINHARVQCISAPVSQAYTPVPRALPFPALLLSSLLLSQACAAYYNCKCRATVLSYSATQRVFEVLTLQHSLKHALTALGAQSSAQIQPRETESGSLHTLICDTEPRVRVSTSLCCNVLLSCFAAAAGAATQASLQIVGPKAHKGAEHGCISFSNCTQVLHSASCSQA